LGGKHIPILEGVDSVVGKQARFKGELVSSGSININGELEGTVAGEGEVIISPGGKVIGEVLGGTVVVSGRVDGNITAKATLEITKSGRVHGDLAGGKIIIEEGSYYQGRVKVESASVEEPATTDTVAPELEQGPDEFVR
jgi:cytoskeletal protein CcmA (bactofilin family)